MIRYINLKTTFETLGTSVSTNPVKSKDSVYVLSMSGSLRYADGVLSRELARERVNVEVKFGNASSVYQGSTPCDLFDMVEAYNKSNMHMKIDQATDISAIMTHIAGDIITSGFEASLILAVMDENDYKKYFRAE